MALLSIAGLQLELADCDNFQRIAGELRRLKARLPWVQLAVLSELATHGVSRDRAEDIGGATETQYCEIARELGLWLVPGSLFQTTGGSVRNVSPVIGPDGSVVARYAKMFPFLPYENGVVAGAEFVVFEIPGVGRIGISNCYDMWFPETIRTLAAMGAEVIVHPSMTNTVDRDVELSIARSNAAMFQLYLLDVNAAGVQGNGRSGMYGPGGEKIYEAGQGRDIMAFELNLDEVRRVRERGWNGLGQPLKSFRDSEVPLPFHQPGSRRTPALDALGPLEALSTREAVHDTFSDIDQPGG